MRKILLASHGYLAKGMKQTLELILGRQVFGGNSLRVHAGM